MGRAGEELGGSHGAISHQVRALEEQLGVKLFSRAKRKLQLTAAGRQLPGSVIKGFDCIVDGSLYLDPGSTAGPLLIACTQTTAASWALRHVGEFQLSHPQIEIHLVEIQPQQKDIPPEIDIAICYGEPIASDRHVRQILAPQLYPVGSPRILHDQQLVNRPEHLTRFPLLHDRQNSWDDWFAAMGVEKPANIRQMYFFNTVIAINAARQGLGIALCNSIEIENELREGQLVKLLDRATPEAERYFLLTDEP